MEKSYNDNNNNRWVEYRDPIDFMDCPSNMEIGLC